MKRIFEIIVNHLRTIGYILIALICVTALEYVIDNLSPEIIKKSVFILFSLSCYIIVHKLINPNK